MSFDVSSEIANDKENSKRIIDDFLENEEFKQAAGEKRPTLLIGLGGTGAKSLYRFRRAMAMEHGTASPKSNPIQYAYIDLIFLVLHLYKV